MGQPCEFQVDGVSEDDVRVEDAVLKLSSEVAAQVAMRRAGAKPSRRPAQPIAVRVTGAASNEPGAVRQPASVQPHTARCRVHPYPYSFFLQLLVSSTVPLTNGLGCRLRHFARPQRRGPDSSSSARCWPRKAPAHVARHLRETRILY
jgi:hypothetical protein